MSHTETIESVRRLLQTTFAEVDSWFEKPEYTLFYLPSSGAWTIASVLEHITLTNHYLLLTLNKQVKVALRRAENGGFADVERSDLQKVDIIGQRGSFEWVRPDHMEPTGQTSLPEIRQTMRQQLNVCLDLLQQLDQGQGRLVKITMSVNQLGKIDLYQWLYFIGQHARRHLQQMESIESESRQKS